MARSCSVRASARGNPGVPATRAEVGESLLVRLFGPTSLSCVERRARGDGFRPDEGRGSDSLRREDGRREPRRELGKTEAVKAGGCPAGHRDASRQIVGGPARRRDDKRAAIGTGREPALRLAETSLGFGTLDDVQGCCG